MGGLDHGSRVLHTAPCFCRRGKFDFDILNFIKRYLPGEEAQPVYGVFCPVITDIRADADPVSCVKMSGVPGEFRQHEKIGEGSGDGVLQGSGLNQFFLREFHQVSCMPDHVAV